MYKFTKQAHLSFKYPLVTITRHHLLSFIRHLKKQNRNKTSGQSFQQKMINIIKRNHFQGKNQQNFAYPYVL